MLSIVISLSNIRYCSIKPIFAKKFTNSLPLTLWPQISQTTDIMISVVLWLWPPEVQILVCRGGSISTMPIPIFVIQKAAISISFTAGLFGSIPHWRFYKGILQHCLLSMSSDKQKPFHSETSIKTDADLKFGKRRLPSTASQRHTCVNMHSIQAYLTLLCDSLSVYVGA